MGLAILVIEVNYVDDNDQEQVEEIRFDQREGKTPLWAKALIAAIEGINYIFSVHPEAIVLKAFDTELEEQQYERTQK